MEKISEVFVNRKTADLAKSKGFDLPVLYCYDEDEGELTSSYSKDVFSPLNYNTSSYKTSKPTQTLVIDWLLTKHKIYVNAVPLGDLTHWNFEVEYYNTQIRGKSPFYQSKHEALENGIQNALTLIVT